MSDDTPYQRSLLAFMSEVDSLIVQARRVKLLAQHQLKQHRTVDPENRLPEIRKRAAKMGVK